MNKNEYSEAYPSNDDFGLDVIQHIASKHNLKLTWDLVDALKDAWAESRLHLSK